MKKSLIILLLGFLCQGVFPQNGTVDARLGYEETWKTLKCTTADSIGQGDSTWTYTVYKKTVEPSVCYYRIYLDSLSGTSDTVDIFLQKKVFGYPESYASETYSNIDTVTYYGTADTVISAYNSSATYSDFYRVLVKERGDNFKVGIDSLMIKIFE